MDYKVKHGNTYIPLNSSANKSVITAATQSRKLCGDDTVKITLQSAEYINFAIGDTIDVFGTTYTINQLPTVKRNGERDYEYTLVFEGLQYALIDRVFLMPDNTEGNNLMFDLAGMMAVLITNINRGNSGKQYVLGTCPTDTEYKNLSLTEKNCLQVLQQLCQEWDTEFTIVEGNDAITINIGAAGTVFGVPFTYGRNGGIYNLNREKGATDVITRLFCYGGTQNLTWYRHNRLCLPSKTKNQSYIEDSTAQATYGIKEAVKNFDEIYPNRIGTVSSVSGCAYNEFIDTSMADPDNGGFDLNAKWPNTTAGYTEWRTIKGLEDTTQNRNIYDNDVVGTTRYLINGETAKIHFNTGALAGYEIDIHSYNHTTQKFVLQPLVDENNYDFPSKTNSTFRIAAGDKYVILGINLPESYKTQAENDLEDAAEDYFATVCTPQPKYSLEIDSLALQRIVAGLHSDGEREVFKVGDAVHITDTDTGVDADIRIDRFERDLIDTWKYKLTLTDEVTYTSQVKTLIELNQIKRVVQESGIADPNKIRRGWKDAEELYNMVFDTEGQIYGEKIQPLSIDTTMLKVGARSQQLTLQNVTFQPNYLGNPAKFEASAGYLVHLSIDPEGPKTWTMTAASITDLASTGLYVYARCDKDGTTGLWLVSEDQIVFDSPDDPDNYNFLIGTLGSVDSLTNTRTFSPTYGFSTINGRYIKTGRVQSADGQTYFDLDQGVIGGNIVFQTRGSSYDQLQTLISGNSTVQGAVTTANRAEGKIDGLEIGGRNFIANTADSKRIPTIGTASSDYVFGKYSLFGLPFKQGENLTISADIDVITLDTQRISVFFYNSITTLAYQGFEVPITNGKITATIRVGGTLANQTDVVMLIYAGLQGATAGNAISISHLKLEKGNRSTDWTPAPEDTEAELTALQTDLQGQIDSKIETWSQVDDPSTNWTTTPLKDQHVGDLWYYTGESTDSRTNNKTYKYTKSGSTYSWTEYSAGGGDLFDKIDGKAAIFYNSTESGYEPDGVQEGDFLLLSDGSGKSFRWLNGAWVSVQDYQAAIAAIEIGGRNLVLRSGDGGTLHAPSSYLVARYTISESLEVGQEYQLTVEATNTGRYYISADFCGSFIVLGSIHSVTTVKITLPITATAQMSGSEIIVYGQDQNYSWAQITGNLDILRIKLEKGNKATDWTPAPEDGDPTARARLDNIDSDSVFSIAEKEAYRTDFEKIVGIGIAVDGTIPTATQLNNSTYAKGSYYQHYNMINSTATNTLTALSTAYTNLRDYLVGNTCLLYTQQDTSGFSRTSLAGLICAYLDAEKAVEIYAENVGNMKGAINTTAATATKVVNIDTMDGAITANMARDMLADADMRMAIMLNTDNSVQNITLQFYYASGSIIPTGRSSADCYLQYLGVRTDQKCYWKAKMVLSLQYDTIDNSLVRFKLTDEENFATVLAFSKAMQGKTTVAGGLVLTETIVAGEGSGQSGMSGANASDNVAFWAGGTVGAAMTYNVPVVIMRDGTARLGLLRFNKDTIEFADETGQARLNIVRGTVPTPTAADVKRNNSSTTPDSPVWSSLSGSGSLATLTTDWAKVFDIGFVQNCSEIHNGMPVHVRGSSSNTFRIQTTAAEYAAYSLTVYIRIGDDNVIQIYHADYLFGSQDINVELQDRYAAFYTSGSSGSCALVAEAQSLSGNISLAVAVSNLQDWYYHDSSKSVTTLASDGLGVIVDNENHFVTKEKTVGNEKRLETTIKGLTDIPGVLWAGTISSSGGTPTPTYKNAAKYASSALTCGQWDNTNKRFAITHRLGTSNFTAMVTPSGSSSVSFRVVKSGDDTLYVYLSAQASFELVLFGTN